MKANRYGVPKKEILTLDGGKIVMFDLSSHAKEFSKDLLNRNVFRLDKFGNEKWRIQSAATGDEATPYTNIYLAEGNKIHAVCWNGLDIEVDSSTGSLGTKKFLK